MEALVEENRSAFNRAQRLLYAMRQRSQATAHQDGRPAIDPEAPGKSAVPNTDPAVPNSDRWLDLDRLAQVELEPQELGADLAATVLLRSAGKAWRPKSPGPQTIRLRFAHPQHIDRVRVEFVEEEVERTQEFVLRWQSEGATRFEEIVRQQYVFSPGGSVCQIEEYHVDLRNLVAIELSVIPDISGKRAFASLARWSLGAPPSEPEASQ